MNSPLGKNFVHPVEPEVRYKNIGVARRFAAARISQSVAYSPNICYFLYSMWVWRFLSEELESKWGDKIDSIECI